MLRILLAFFLLFCISSVQADCLSSSRWTGVNLAGAEFAPHAIPGKLNENYTYPTDKTLLYFQDQGANVFRLPILWERIQSRPLSDLDEQHIIQLNRLIRFAEAHQLCLVLDLHNYGRWQGRPLSTRDQQQLTDVWFRLAALQPSGRNLALGLMNEPEGMSRTAWFNLAQAVILNLRQQHIPHWILVSGGNWSGAHSWFSGSAKEPSNATLFSRLQTPYHRTVIELHQYADKDHSGTQTDCASPATLTSYLQKVSDWAVQHHQRLFLGEFGVASSQNCLDGLQQMAIQLQHPAWKGWTYWAAGEWWKNYAFSIQPDAAHPIKPQLQVLKPFFAH